MPGRKRKPVPTATPSTPSCPSWLTKDAKKEWRRITPQLASRGVLELCDLAQLAAYCECFSRWQDAEKLVDLHGIVMEVKQFSRTGELLGTVLKRNPASIAASGALKDMSRLAGSFGFDPASRTKLAQEAPAPEDDVSRFLTPPDDDEEETEDDD
ncbi:phage terminase small subunit P27 family [Acidipila sp. EB88]|uniref:phage terminase small subunit P27 family n=1 Tax=Acidipila sp. EB88 TaxID=2305226 RepID=UPI000F5EF342|nr:phage terminase small subunit P27 family [Acidipila sp. EB88]RRA48999.1 phage terminase small subunit P27 family [Acidipila sp. EB88]